MCRICCTCRMRCMRRQRRWPRGNAAAHAWRAVYRQTTGSRQLLTANQQWPTASLLPTSGLRRSLPCMALRMAMPAGAACVPAMCTRHAQKLAQPHLPAPLAPEPPHQRKYPPSRPQPHLALHDRAMRLHRQQSVARCDALPCTRLRQCGNPLGSIHSQSTQPPRSARHLLPVISALSAPERQSTSAPCMPAHAAAIRKRPPQLPAKPHKHGFSRAVQASSRF